MGNDVTGLWSAAIFSERSDPDVPLRAVALGVAIVSSATLGEFDVGSAECIVERTGEAPRIDEGLDWLGRDVLALGPDVGQLSADQ